MCYLPEACYIPLSFSLRFCCFLTRTKSSDHRSINIVAPEANFATISRRHAFFPEKSTRFWPRFWRPKSLFSAPEPSPSWSVMRAKTLGTINSSSFGTQTSFQAGRDHLRHAGRKICFYTAKNQAGCAPYYWPACQNLRVPCSK